MDKNRKLADFMRAYGTIFAGIIIVIAFSILKIGRAHV